MNPANIDYPPEIINRFSLESNKLAGVDKSDDSHVKALQEAIEKGLKQEPLAFNDLSRWHNLIVAGRMNTVHEVASRKINKDQALQEVNKIIEFINDRSNHNNYPKNDIELVSLIAKTFQDFEHLDYFYDAHHSLSRIVINYVNSRLYQPIIIFKYEEKDDLEKSINDPNYSKLYFAKKIKEMAFDQFFHLLPHCTLSGDSYKYSDDDAHGIIIEYHELAAAEKNWKK